MKRLILLIVIAIAIADFGCRETDDYVLTGQLYYVGNDYAPEKINGKVQEIRINNFRAIEENGKVVRGDIYSNPGHVEKYNSSGTILSYDALYAEGSRRWSVEVEAEGKIINKALYYINDTLLVYTKNTYTGNNLTEVKLFLGDTLWRSVVNVSDTLWRSVVYDYDQNGNRIKWQVFNHKNELYNYVDFVYNSEGFLEHWKRYDPKGEVTRLEDFILNDKGDKISSHYMINGRMTDWEINKYEYDNKENWIRRVYYRDNKPIWISEREIKYFE